MHKSFTVYEEVDHSKKSMIQFLTKVGSIQNLQNINEYNRMQNEATPIRSGQRVLSASMSPFVANQAMQIGAVRTGGPLHETASNYHMNST